MTRIIFLGFFLLIACAEKTPQSPQSLPSSSAQTGVSFFMSRPQPTAPVVAVFDDELNSHKLVNYRKDDKLNISGGASFAINSLKEIAKPAKKIKASLYVFDLRQESHGYINDKPMTWQSEHDWSNVDMNHDEAVQRERRLLLDTAIGTKLSGISVQSTETEESVVRSRGYEYIRLTVTDHLRPSDTEVDRFLSALKSLSSKHWIHFHCRSGKGRTTVFMIMYDMLQNAQKNSLEEIVKRQTDLSHDEDPLVLPAEGSWNYIYAKERADFLREFYNFAKVHPQGEGMFWTEWVRK